MLQLIDGFFKLHLLLQPKMNYLLIQQELDRMFKKENEFFNSKPFSSSKN
jgi:hypothetical protein